ncbi:MAG: hypothetical protein HY257_12315, partial [Chloroflexi bacterium]|nr:hypothetical protein [Chloroflexota bacterium]
MMSNPSLIDIAMRALNLPRDSFSITRRPAIGHQTNRLYDVRAQGKHYIAKEYLQSGEESDCARREFDALHLLAPLDLAPQPIFFEPARGAIVIYEFLEGEMWDRRKPAPNELRALARAFLKLHELPTTDLWLSR